MFPKLYEGGGFIQFGTCFQILHIFVFVMFSKLVRVWYKKNNRTINLNMYCSVLVEMDVYKQLLEKYREGDEVLSSDQTNKYLI